MAERESRYSRVRVSRLFFPPNSVACWVRCFAVGIGFWFLEGSPSSSVRGSFFFSLSSSNFSSLPLPSPAREGHQDLRSRPTGLSGESKPDRDRGRERERRGHSHLRHTRQEEIFSSS
eukprot:scaffold770_cov255-Pinguiococcus_pyrenoidosus.AAC.36